MFDPQSKILVVDDAVSMRLTIINILKELGFSNFTEANNGKNAFALIEGGGKFDLILSDHNMPECTGLEFLKMVRGLDAWKKTPFIMVTSETEKGMIVQAVQLGASNYVTKPVTKDALKAKLEATFARMKT
jgi:two-component system, chemotaxis family, chemotaxis protein CheY